jgi:hypothetical protein
MWHCNESATGRSTKCSRPPCTQWDPLLQLLPVSILTTQVTGDDLAQRLAAADVDQEVGDALLVQLARTSAYDTPGLAGTIDGCSPTCSRSRAQLGDAEGG